MRNSKQLLNVDDAAFRIGLRPATIRKMILDKKIAVVKIGRAVRIPVEEVEAIISNGWREPAGIEKKGGL